MPFHDLCHLFAHLAAPFCDGVRCPYPISRKNLQRRALPTQLPRPAHAYAARYTVTCPPPTYRVMIATRVTRAPAHLRAAHHITALRAPAPTFTAFYPAFALRQRTADSVLPTCDPSRCLPDSRTYQRA